MHVYGCCLKRYEVCGCAESFVGYDGVLVILNVSRVTEVIGRRNMFEPRTVSKSFSLYVLIQR